MKPLDEVTAAAALRTAELNGVNPEHALHIAQVSKEISLTTMRIMVDSAQGYGISDMTIVSAMLQLCAAYMRDIHPGAAIKQLRLMADALEAKELGNADAKAQAMEAMQLNGMSFTAAIHAEKNGGRN